jgi:hypothetical protein
MLSPKPLGKNFDYLGSTNTYKCYIVPTCEPGATYYYGTNIPLTEIESHLKDSHYKYANDGGDGSANTSFRDLTFSHEAKTLTITYYNHPQSIVQREHLRKTSKKYVISISNEDYDIVQLINH